MRATGPALLAALAAGALGAAPASAVTERFTGLDCVLQHRDQTRSPSYAGWIGAAIALRAVNPHPSGVHFMCPVTHRPGIRPGLREVRVTATDNTAGGHVGCYAHAADPLAGITFFSASASTSGPGIQPVAELALGPLQTTATTEVGITCYVSPNPGAQSLSAYNGVITYAVTR